MGREALLLPDGSNPLAGINVPMEMLARADLTCKLLECLVRIFAGARPEDAARVVGVTFRPPLGQEVQIEDIAREIMQKEVQVDGPESAE
jgi:hypothetical protein